LPFNLRIFKNARRPDIVSRSFRVSLVVGTILVGINQGDAILDGRVGLTELLKIVLTYLVPYCVSTYSSVVIINNTD